MNNLLTRIKIPNTIVLIFSIMIIMAVLTWIIPGGEYARELINGREILQPESYKQVQSVPQGLVALLIAPIRGFMAAAQIIAFIFIVGGAFSIIQKTGAIDAFIRWVAYKQDRKPIIRKLIIPIFMVMFSFFGSLFGMSEEVIPFILIFVPLAVSLGYDSIVGAAIPFVGAAVGFASAFVNPFTLGIAQSIAELPPLSGMGYRIGAWLVFTSAAIVFVHLYARRIRNNPQSSVMYNVDKYWRDHIGTQASRADQITLNRRNMLILSVFSAAMLLLIFGVIIFEWYINEIAALFLGTALIVGFISHLKINDLASGFIDGAKDFVNVAFIIALARSILVLATDGKIIDTILHSLSIVVEGAHPVFAAQLMFIVQSIINVFIPSGSGQAALVMPIMAPLGDLLGVSRQTAVLAFQMGDGFTNMIIPTSGVTMGVLGIAKIPFEKWFVWMLPLITLLFVLGFLALIPPVLFNWGPF